MEPLTGCTRCGGFIIPEAFRDIGLCSIGWRCLHCGEMVDSVILQNRVEPPAPLTADEGLTEWEQESDSEGYRLGVAI